MDAEKLESLIGHRFASPDLLAAALTHPSATAARKGGASPFERLEFLGDRVLGLAVAELLVERFPKEAEGDLAKRLAQLVRKESCAEVAGELGLVDLIRLSKGESEAGGRANPGILADSCEALIGALFLDAGFAPARELVRRLWTPLLETAARPPKDAKTALQEWAQARGLGLPVYEILASSGPAHAPSFTVSAALPGIEPARGGGASKRAAEQAAAAALLERIGGE